MKRSIPAFNRFGLLPNGIHPCTESEFRSRFLADFSDSLSRPGIMKGFMRLRRDATAHGISAVQWIDGSFVEDREPRDVDVVHFIDFDHANGLDEQGRHFISDVLAGSKATQAAFGTHSFFVPACNPDHHFYETYEKLRQYWRKWFGTTRPSKNSRGHPISGRKKGIIRLNLGDEQKLPTVSPEEFAGDH